MSRVFTRSFAAALALGLVASYASDAFAGWRHGSSGSSSSGSSSSSSSSGGWGSSSSGSGGYRGHGSSGSSSSGGRHHRRHHSSGSSSSSSGSWGSSSSGSSGYYHGSSGYGSSGYGSSGYGSSSSGVGYGSGSHGGVIYSAPVESGYAPAVAPPVVAPPAAPMGNPTSVEDGMLTVSVADEAQIFVNGSPTSSKGGLRQFVSRNLERGMTYSYEVRAVVTRNGQPVEQTKTVQLRAGNNADLAFDFPSASSKVETALTVHVPENAKVYLAGNPTKATGSTRVFRTSGLSEGALWGEYLVRVEFEQDGRTISREETITIRGGDQKELRFDVDVTKVADAR